MVIDTNILIAYLRNDAQVINAIKQNQIEGVRMLISVISITEILSFASLTEEQLIIIKRFIANFISIPLDDRLAEMAAFFRRQYNLSLPDSVIAATAMVYNVPLCTRDKQLRKVKELALFDL